MGDTETKKRKIREQTVFSRVFIKAEKKWAAREKPVWHRSDMDMGRERTQSNEEKEKQIQKLP